MLDNVSDVNVFDSCADADKWLQTIEVPDFTKGFSTDGNTPGQVIVPVPSPSALQSANALQQLSELNGRLLAHVQSLLPPPDNTYDQTTTVSELQMFQVTQLAADVIESSIALRDTLNNNQLHLNAANNNMFDLPSSDSTATILQILTAYIRLAQLHYALYQHIKRLLQASGNTDTSAPLEIQAPLLHTPVPFPSLHIGGVSLSAYPRFQYKFVMQICVHHLGEVEALLGLPAGLCVSEQMVGNGGILRKGADGITVLVQTIMRQAESTVKGIRNVLTELTEQTKGTIQI